MNASIVIPIKQIIKSIALVRKGAERTIVPYNKDLLGVDNLFKMIFLKTLDPLLLENNREKFIALKQDGITRSFFTTVELFREGLFEDQANTGSGASKILDSISTGVPGYAYFLKNIHL